MTSVADSAKCVIAASAAAWKQLVHEVESLRPGVESGEHCPHEVWHSMMLAAVIAGIPPRDAANLIFEGMTGARHAGALRDGE